MTNDIIFDINIQSIKMMMNMSPNGEVPIEAKKLIASMVEQGYGSTSIAKEINVNQQTVNKYHRKFFPNRINTDLPHEETTYVRTGRSIVPDARTQGYMLKAVAEDGQLPSEVANTYGMSENNFGSLIKKHVTNGAYRAMMQLPEGYKVHKSEVYTKGTRNAAEIQELIREHKETEDNRAKSTL